MSELAELSAFTKTLGELKSMVGGLVEEKRKSAPGAGLAQKCALRWAGGYYPFKMMCVCVYLCVCVSVSVCLCVCVYVCSILIFCNDIYTCTHIHTYTHTYIHTYIHAHIHTK